MDSSQRKLWEILADLTDSEVNSRHVLAGVLGGAALGGLIASGVGAVIGAIVGGLVAIPQVVLMVRVLLLMSGIVSGKESLKDLNSPFPPSTKAWTYRKKKGIGVIVKRIEVDADATKQHGSNPDAVRSEHHAE
jgi:hypothetical protein